MSTSFSTTPLRLPRRVRTVGDPWWIAVCLCLLLALVIRVAYVLETPQGRTGIDGSSYNEHAQSIASGHGYPLVNGPVRMVPACPQAPPSPAAPPCQHYIAVPTKQPTAYRPPGYPYFLAVIYKLVGPGSKTSQARGARIAQAILGTAAVAMIGFLARRFWDRRIALVAMFIAAIYVPFVTVGDSYASEALFVPLELGALCAMVEQRRRQHGVRYALLAGFLAGLATLTRPNGILAVAMICLGVWTLRPRLRLRSVRAPAVVCAAAVAALVPWTVRNAVVLHSFVPVSTETGNTLAGTYNHFSRVDAQQPGVWKDPSADTIYRSITTQRGNLLDVDYDKALQSAAISFIGRHPFYPVSVVYHNTWRLADVTGLKRARFTALTIGLGPRASYATVYCFWVVAALALVGALTARARRAPRVLWLYAALLYLSIAVVTSETPRFRAPFEPFIVLLAALGVVWLFDRARPLAQGAFARRLLRRTPRPRARVRLLSKQSAATERAA